MDKKFWFAVATLVGSTVGVGIYGMPFAFQKAGFGIGLLFLIGIGGLFIFINLMYGEIILRTHEQHQFIGYTNKYLGTVAKKINLLTFMLGAYGALIGITIISGNFLTNVASFFLDFSPAGFSTLFTVIAAIFIFRGRRSVSRVDLFMMLVVGSIILLIGLMSAKHISLSNYVLANRDFWFLPFGVILFAINGMPGVPLVREMLVGKEDEMKRALIIGTIIPMVFYLVFSFIIVGVTSDTTTPDAISGLLATLGGGVVFVGSLLGFLTSSTIFLNLGLALKESFQQDFNFKRRWAWLLTVVPPYLLFLSGTRNFIDIIGLVGGVAVSIETIVLIFLYAKARKGGDRMPEYSIRLPTLILYLMMLIFAAGTVYTLLVK